MMQYIKDNLNAVKAQLAAAQARMPKKDCRILAAVKYALPGEIEALLDSLEIPWESSEQYLDEQSCWEIEYEFTIMGMPDPEPEDEDNG